MFIYDFLAMMQTEAAMLLRTFPGKKPQGKIDFRVIKSGCTIASDTGIYTFALHEKKIKLNYDCLFFLLFMNS